MNLGKTAFNSLSLVDRLLRSNNSYKRNSLLGPILIIAIPTVVLLSLLVMLFRGVNGEEKDIQLDAFMNNTASFSTSRDDFRKIRAEQEALIANQTVNKVKDYTGVTANVTFNPAVTPSAKAFNLRVYQAAARYFNKDTVKNIPGEWADPLIYLALTNVEYGSSNDPEKSFSAALPTRFMTKVTPDMVDTYGIKEVLEEGKYFDGYKPFYKHQGPLQMSLKYGVNQAMIPGDLKGTERTRSIKTLRDIYPSNDPKNLYVSFPYNGKATGDRFNWPDAVNRAAGFHDYNYGLYLKNSTATKTGDYAITNRYSYIALMALSHNTGESVLTQPDKFKAGIWSSIKEARRYANALGRGDVVSLITKEVESNLKTYRDNPKSRTLLMTPGSSFTKELTAYVESRNYVADGYDSGNGQSDHSAHKLYPVRVLYAYIMMEKLYQGG